MKKAKQTSESIQLGILLALSGGLMDAYSFLLRGEVFANAQTGNILLLGVHLSQGHLIECMEYLFPVLAFVFGIVLSHMIRFKGTKLFHWRQWALGFEIVILISVAFISLQNNLLANSLISFACGIQVQTFQKIHGSNTATTMCIGNLRNGTDSFISYLETKDKNKLENSLLYGIVILCFVIGAILGNFSIQILGVKAILVSCIFLCLAWGIMFVDREK